MNRKVATIIIIAMFFIALIVISIIGVYGLDWSQNIIVTEIYICDKDGNRLPTSDVGGNNIVKLTVELDSFENTYSIYYKIVPDKADKKTVEFIYDISNYARDPQITIVGNGQGGSVMLKFGAGYVPEEGFLLTIESTDGSEQSCSVLIVRNQSGSGETDL